jgi:hypothetical protein
MDDLRIPVMNKEVVIEFLDGVKAGGVVFIPPAAPDHDGAMRLAEWLNDADAFFPFKAHGEGEPVLVNKQNVLSLTAYHDRDSDDYDETNGVPKLYVRVETPYGKVEGDMILDMPENKLRALDVLNSEGRFVFLVDGGREVHVNKKFITKATEVEKGGDEETA